MATPTEHEAGPINLRQEEPHAQRFLAAQSRLYSDAKHIRKFRLPMTFSLAGLSVVAGLVFPGARPSLGLAGALVRLGWSALALGLAWGWLAPWSAWAGPPWRSAPSGATG